jgi:hypothetical protein
MSGAPTRPRPVALVLLAFTVLGLALGSALHSATATPAAPTLPPGLISTVVLREVILDPGPVALLEVSVHNRGDDSVMITSVGVATSGEAPPEMPVNRRVAAGTAEMVEVRAPARCAGDPSTTVEVSVWVRADQERGADRPATLTAIRSGLLAESGLCPAVLQSLPPGVQIMAETGRVTWSAAGGADIQATGLPAGTVRVVRADAWTFPVASAARVDQDGVLRLAVAEPRRACGSRLDRPRIPAGLEIEVDRTNHTFVDAYLPIGPELPRRLLASYRKACPDSPFVEPANPPRSTT